MIEKATLFGATSSLVGIVSESSDKKSNHYPAFIILNSGLVHHVGPNRLTVKIARELTGMGGISFRMDFSGIGDSPPVTENIPLRQRWVNETCAAMDWLKAEKGINRFVLIGNCSGAAISFLTSRLDQRVIAAFLINFGGPKKLLRYYVKLGLTNPKVWLRIFSGVAKFKDVVGAMPSNIEIARRKVDTQRYGKKEIIDICQCLLDRGTRLFFAFSEWDPGLSYYNAFIKKKLTTYTSKGLTREEIIAGTNHDFSTLNSQENLIQIIRKWATTVMTIDK